jgi:uncharacterized phage-associated protein
VSIKFKFNYKKTTQAINFFCEEAGGKLNKMKAMKLLFLADKAHLLKYGRSISGDEYFAMEMGPVLSKTWSLLANKSDYDSESEHIEYFKKHLSFDSPVTLKSIAPLDQDEFSDSDIECLTSVANLYSRVPQNQIIDILHTFPEWESAWNSRPPKSKRSKMSIETIVVNPEMRSKARLLAKAQSLF